MLRRCRMVQLSANTFYAIIESLRSYNPDIKVVDKRKNPRVGLRADAAVRVVGPDGLGQPMTVGVRDLSKTGIGLMFHEAVRVGAQMILFLSGPKHPKGMSLVMYTVMCCRPLSDGLWAIGAQL